MITTVYHYLDVSDMQWHVSHLFEHLVIRGFLSMLEENGDAPELIGWINGETFEQNLYIDAGFYSPEIAERFERYIDSLPAFDENAIRHAVATASAEERLKLEIADEEIMREELAVLSHREWDKTSLHANNQPAEIILESPAEDNYSDVVLQIYANELSDDEAVVFLRLRVVLIDMILRALDAFPGVYPQGNSRLAKQDDSMAYMSLFTAAKEYAPEDIQETVEKYIHAYDVRSAYPAINRHFEVFAAEPLWQSIPIEYFKETGLNVTNAQIAALITPELIEGVFAKIAILARLATDDDYAHIA